MLGLLKKKAVTICNCLFLFHYISTMVRFIIFLVLNFSALGLGSLLMGGSPASNEWYQTINKAPWTPPGWVFGFAWTTIMICLSIFMWKLSDAYSFSQLKPFYIIYALHWVLNVLWNPLFFNFQLVLAAQITLVILTLLLAWMLYYGYVKFSGWWLLLSPYLIWLIIANSLNFYILLKN